MKNILLLVVLLPLLSFGQKLELSEGLGYSNQIGNSKIQSGGYCNNLKLSYHFSKPVFISAFYEFSNWNPGVNNLGADISIVIHSVYFGANVSKVLIRSSQLPQDIKVNYQTDLAYGVHVGYTHRIYKKLSLQCEVRSNFFHIERDATLHDNVLRHYNAPISLLSTTFGVSYSFF